MAIGVMLVDDHAIMRAGLQRLIKDQPDMEIIGEASNGLRAVDLAAELEPDVIIMDVTMPDLNGIEATRRIKEKCPDIHVIALSAFQSPEFVLGMIRAGANGFLLKEDLFDDLLVAIYTVLRGQSYLCPKVASVVLNECSREKPPTMQLNEQDTELVKQLAQGLSAKAIAEQQGLSVKTVEGRRRRLMKKLNLDSVAQLVQYAITEGVLRLPTSRES